tara:strand:+ start:7276 stop:7443 length:168 start_codon:yes stop_codon:yes gene_type:complete
MKPAKFIKAPFKMPKNSTRDIVNSNETKKEQVINSELKNNKMVKMTLNKDRKELI